MKDFTIYSSGLIYASVCTNLDEKEATKRINEEMPTGVESKWELSKENFKTGEKNGIECNQQKGYKHYLFSC